ncbi:hypothetical protein ABO01nite_07470 [Asaia bogorensis NBRC 16594]|uniref:Uncharacterized protein n=1 Tax=Asaia bogorensis NBRC 16594 TaxID=1231624 RepID=A0AAN4R1K6_9PROT|nr:hypothetical protein ABO01nite_07470 [Asaia bogorensis NBRC 16594]
MNAEGCHFGSHHFRNALQSEFATTVGRQARHRDQTTHRCHVHDKPVTSFTKKRQKGFGDSNGPKDIYVELTAHFSKKRLLQNTFMSIAGIIDEHIDRTVILLCLCDDVRNTIKGGNVTQDRACIRQALQ